MEEINITEGILAALVTFGVTWGTLTQRIKALEKRMENTEIGKGGQDKEITRIDREGLKLRGRIQALENLVFPRYRRGETLNPDDTRNGR